jgi:hypothetical protein
MVNVLQVVQMEPGRMEMNVTFVIQVVQHVMVAPYLTVRVVLVIYHYQPPNNVFPNVLLNFGRMEILVHSVIQLV